MDNAFIPGLAERKKEPARHSRMPISLLFPACGQHLERRSWCLLGTVKSWSPSHLFLNRPHSFQMLKGTEWKRIPSSHQACVETCSWVQSRATFECVSYEPHTAL